MVFALLFAACSRETPAPAVQNRAPATTTAMSSPAPRVAAAAPGGTYEDAINWFRSAPAFHFVVDEAGVHAEGDMQRETVGSETITFRANGEEWRAASGVRGVTWQRRSGDAWTAADAPPYGNRLFQRVTLAFDPQKKEGAAQPVEPNHYRFTDANTGQVHEVWLREGRIERMTIGDTVELKISAR